MAGYTEEGREEEGVNVNHLSPVCQQSLTNQVRILVPRISHHWKALFETFPMVPRLLLTDQY